MARADSPNVVNARRVLRGEDWPSDKLIDLSEQLQNESKFSWARKILRKIREEHKLYSDPHLCQRHAFCTYKDADLPGDRRFDEAIAIMNSVFDLETETDSETLGMLGSIYKQKWQFDNQMVNLERAYFYYNRGYESWQKKVAANQSHDAGYTAINTAYILDLLSYTELMEAQAVNADVKISSTKKSRATQIRHSILKVLSEDEKLKKDYWYYVTLAEAYFGLYQYENANEEFKKARSLAGNHSWEYESSSKQMASLAQTQIAIFDDLKYGQQLIAQAFIDPTIQHQMILLARQIKEGIIFRDLFLLGKYIEKETSLSVENKDKGFSGQMKHVQRLIRWVDRKNSLFIRVQRLTDRMEWVRSEAGLFHQTYRVLENMRGLLAQSNLNAADRKRVRELATQLTEMTASYEPMETIRKPSAKLGQLVEQHMQHYQLSQMGQPLQEEPQTMLPSKLTNSAWNFAAGVHRRLYKDQLGALALMILQTKTGAPAELDQLRLGLRTVQDVRPGGKSLREDRVLDDTFTRLNATLYDDELTEAELETLHRHARKVTIHVAREWLEDRARIALKTFLGDHEAVDTAFHGKVGLALSGGGFRASLYHIGVLARLAELDILRRVETLSCVSGGSIIGAFYYLKVKKLYETKLDEDITREDFIQLVKETEQEFLAAVQKNLRMRVFTNPWYNLQMIFLPDKNRSQRLAYLYEKYFYHPVVNEIERVKRQFLGRVEKEGTDEEGEEKIRMDDLRIYPLLDPTKGGFSFKRDNWRRRNKIPNLILNATSLNTGHNWQFTSSWMGEPPASIVSEIDSKFRLRRMYYYEAPDDYKNMSLGEAVAASSGVPGLFEPLELRDLYPGVTVQLVDGGVHDNQGVVGLLEQECKVFFISDSSGQVISQENAGAETVKVLLRTNEVLQDRIRESQFINLNSRKQAALIKEMMFVHLKKDLGEPPKNWKHCEDPAEFKASAASQTQQDLTDYGIRTEVQKRLATVRTDLDSFNDSEAYALMYSGYKMTEYEHERSTRNFFPDVYPPEDDWAFLIAQPYTQEAARSERLERLLDVSANLPFKVFKISRTWRMIGYTLVGLMLSAAVVLLYLFWSYNFQFTVGGIAVMVLFFMLPLLVGKVISWYRDYRSSLRTVATKITVGVLGALVAHISVGVLNRIYLRKGEMPLTEEGPGDKLYLGFLSLLLGGAAFYFTVQIGQFMEDHLDTVRGLEVDPHRWIWFLSLVFLGGGAFLLLYYIFLLFKPKKEED